MLVLSRKSRQSIVVGGSAAFERILKVTVLEIGGGHVKLGFEVDRDVPVHRSEVWERMQPGSHQDSLPKGPGPPVIPLHNGAGPRTMKMPATVGGAPRPCGILIADDEPSVRKVLNAAMRQQGFSVWLAASGQEALDLYRLHRETIDVVLLDVHMPGLDGFRTLAALRETNPEVCCCFMSGDLGSHAESILDAAAFIRKPFRPAKVAQLLWKLASSPDWQFAAAAPTKN